MDNTVLSVVPVPQTINIRLVVRKGVAEYMRKTVQIWSQKNALEDGRMCTYRKPKISPNLARKKM